jgi:ABC-type lipoprotein release transport system permease subunit
MIAIIIGISSGIFVLAFYGGMIQQRLDNALRTEVSHIQIHARNYKNDYDVKETIPNGYDILKYLQKNDIVLHASGRIIVQGMIATSNGSKGIMINGVIPIDEAHLTSLNKKVITGQYFSSAQKNDIIISTSLAQTLKVHCGNKVVLTFQDSNNDLVTSAFRIVGLYKTINGPYDESQVFVHIQSIDSLLGIHHTFHEIAMLVNNQELIDPMVGMLKLQYPILLIEDWKAISPELGITLSVGNQMVFVYMGIILLALAFGIVNTMMMSVLERTREIGMLIALGMNQRYVFSMIVLETTFLIFAATPIGMMISIIAIMITNQTGIELSMLKATASNFGYDPIVYPILKWYDIQMTILLIIITTFLSALLPARKALTLLPVESIKK